MTEVGLLTISVAAVQILTKQSVGRETTRQRQHLVCVCRLSSRRHGSRYKPRLRPTMRSKPNIIVTGTPGVGKTSHCTALASDSSASRLSQLQHLSINSVVKEWGCHEGWDEEHKSWIVDEDRLLDVLEDEKRVGEQGGFVIDWHACDLFPRSWIDLVVVLRTDSTVLYDRLAQRHYPAKKLEENMDAEIMQVLLEEARLSYDEEIVVELRSDSADDIEANVERIEAWIRNWRSDRGHIDGAAS